MALPLAPVAAARPAGGAGPLAPLSAPADAVGALQVLPTDLPAGETVGVGLFLLIGLLGGAHCVGMCGPLVSLYADRLSTDDRRGPSWRTLRQLAAFNLGRTLGYAAVGAALGTVGAAAVDAGAALAVGDGVRGGVGIVVGVAVVAAGLGYLWSGTAGHGPSVPLVGGAFRRVYGLLAERVTDWVEGPRVVGLGAVHALLPCPLLYPAYLYALALGSPLWGAVSLGALGLGTFPGLFAYGAAVGAVPARHRVALHRGLGVLFVVLGYVPLSNGLVTLGVPVPRIPLPAYQPLASLAGAAGAAVGPSTAVDLAGVFG
jgi:sulfite exporter TauE/SafE